MARPDNNGNIVCTGCERELPGNVAYFHRHRDAFKPKCKECRGGEFGIHDVNKVVESEDGYKICSTCHQHLPATKEYFYQSPKTSDGFTPQCKGCHGEGTDFGIHHPNMAGITPNGDEIPEGHWFCPDCEQILQLNDRNFYSTNGKFNLRCKACHTLRANQQRREVGSISGKEWKEIQMKWAEFDPIRIRCAYCGERVESAERDHIIPVSEGGETTPENIVPACESCNRSKSSKVVTAWYIGSDAFDAERWTKILDHMENGI